MIVLLRSTATAADVRSLADRIRSFGLEAVVLDDAKGRALEVLGDDRGRVLSLAGDPSIEEILTRRRPVEGGEPLWPHFALRVGMLAVGLIAALLLLSAFVPPGLGDSPSRPVASQRAEWYLRPPTAVLEAFPASLRWLGGVAVLLFGLALVALPWIDRWDPATPRGRAVGLALRGAGALVVVVSLVLVFGALS